jgi:RNA polymerase sigma factor (TIGR02999 family)
MSDVTKVLQAIEEGHAQAAADLLPLIYDELRRLAEQKLMNERPGQTLNATALVHEAYLRLVGAQGFANRRHFFAAAAESMRRILVENARRKSRLKHGGGRRREPFDTELAVAPCDNEELLALDDALSRFAKTHPQKARLVELRFFAGLTGDEAADVLGVSPSTADRDWVYARAWLQREMDRGEEDPASGNTC